MYRNLEAELKRNAITRERLAQLLGVTVSTISEKLTKPNRLKVHEAKLIRETFFPTLTLDYLFDLFDGNTESA